MVELSVLKQPSSTTVRRVISILPTRHFENRRKKVPSQIVISTNFTYIDPAGTLEDRLIISWRKFDITKLAQR